MQVEQITGNDIQRGDVIRSAAMPKAMRVAFLNVSSTGNTIEVDVTTETGGMRFYRIGRTSKIKRYTTEEGA